MILDAMVTPRDSSCRTPNQSSPRQYPCQTAGKGTPEGAVAACDQNNETAEGMNQRQGQSSDQDSPNRQPWRQLLEIAQTVNPNPPSNQQSATEWARPIHASQPEQLVRQVAAENNEPPQGHANTGATIRRQRPPNRAPIGFARRCCGARQTSAHGVWHIIITTSASANAQHGGRGP